MYSLGISFGVGKEFDKNIKLSNRCTLSFPSLADSKERLFQINTVKQIIKILIEEWNPDKVVLNSSDLSNILNVFNDIGWVTYRKTIKKMLKINNKLIHEPILNGHLFYLKTEDGKAYDYSLINELLVLKDVI